MDTDFTKLHYTIVWIDGDGDPIVASPIETRLGSVQVEPANDSEAISLARLAIIDNGVENPGIFLTLPEHAEDCIVLANPTRFDIEEMSNAENPIAAVAQYVLESRLIAHVTGLPVFVPCCSLSDDKVQYDEVITHGAEVGWGMYREYLEKEISLARMEDSLLHGNEYDRFSDLWAEYSLRAHEGVLRMIAAASISAERLMEVLGSPAADGAEVDINDLLDEDQQAEVMYSAQYIKALPFAMKGDLMRAARKDVTVRTDALTEHDLSKFISELESFLKGD